MNKSIEKLLTDAVHGFMDIHKLDKLLIFPEGNGFTLEGTPPENVGDIRELFECIAYYMLDNKILRLLFEIENDTLCKSELKSTAEHTEPIMQAVPYTVMADIEKTLCLPTKNAKSLM